MSTQPPAFDAYLDACGLTCPLPLLKAKVELSRLASGATLKISATDAGSQRDLNAFARLAGHQMLHEEQDQGVFYYWLKKA